MPAVVIEGIAPWDGRYEFDDWQLTNRECHRIKLICGVRAGELVDALDANDRGAVTALAAVIMERHGHNVDVEELWDGRAAAIRIELGEGDARPPAIPPSGDETASEQTASTDSSGRSSEPSGA